MVLSAWPRNPAVAFLKPGHSLSPLLGRVLQAGAEPSPQRAYREFDRQSELALGDLGRHEAVAVRKKRSRRVPLDDEETSEEAVRSKS
jgi:hypothetical protein